MSENYKITQSQLKMSSSCDLPETSLEPYDVQRHIEAIFIILGSSLIGTALPILSYKSSRFQLNPFIILLLKSFGTGVILATGYVHMFTPADQNLSSDCLKDWPIIGQFPAWAGVFALAATLGTQMIQTTAILHFSNTSKNSKPANGDSMPNSARSAHSQSNCCGDDESDEIVDLHGHDHCHPSLSYAKRHAHVHGHPDKIIVDTPNASPQKLIRSDSLNVHSVPNEHDHSSHRHSSHSHGEFAEPESDLEAGTSSSIKPLNSDHRNTSSTLEIGALTLASNIHSDNCCNLDHAHLVDTHTHRQITAYILEFGIALHSIIIGITVGVARQELIGLVIAVTFHQFFEGFALATTAFEAGFKSQIYPIMMSLIYTLTTPIGIVIGILIAQWLQANVALSLIVLGALDAVSAGILIYDALVNMMTVNITHNRYFARLSLSRKAIVFVSLWTGVAAMSILGIWV